MNNLKINYIYRLIVWLFLDFATLFFLFILNENLLLKNNVIFHISETKAMLFLDIYSNGYFTLIAIFIPLMIIPVQFLENKYSILKKAFILKAQYYSILYFGIATLIINQLFSLPNLNSCLCNFYIYHIFYLILTTIILLWHIAKAMKLLICINDDDTQIKIIENFFKRSKKYWNSKRIIKSYKRIRIVIYLWNFMFKLIHKTKIAQDIDDLNNLCNKSFLKEDFVKINDEIKQKINSIKINQSNSIFFNLIYSIYKKNEYIYSDINYFSELIEMIEEETNKPIVSFSTKWLNLYLYESMERVYGDRLILNLIRKFISMETENKIINSNIKKLIEKLMNFIKESVYQSNKYTFYKLFFGIYRTLNEFYKSELIFLHWNQILFERIFVDSNNELNSKEFNIISDIFNLGFMFNDEQLMIKTLKFKYKNKKFL